MYQIVIAEDEGWLRSELVEMIERMDGGFTVAGEAIDGEDAWNMIHELWPAILITDIRMPRRDGLELLRDMYEAGLPIVSIIVSGYDEFAYAQQAVRYGVSEYLLKPIDHEQLKEALLKSKERLGLFQELNDCFRLVNAFMEELPSLEPAGRSQALKQLVKQLRHVQMTYPKSRKSAFLVLADKLLELSRLTPAEEDALPGRPDWEEMNDVLSYFEGIIELWAMKASALSGNEMRQVIRKACEYIESHYMNPLTLVKVAQQANLSPSYFGYLFKQHTGQSFVGYLNGVRIQKAKALLMERDIKVYEAAEMVGFVSLPHFNRTFKTITGMTPNDYRKGMGLT